MTSFDLGIDNEPEDLSLLIVEDSLDKNEDTNQDQDVMFGDEVILTTMMRLHQSKQKCLKM